MEKHRDTRLRLMPSRVVSTLLLVTIMLLLVHSVASSSRPLQNLQDNQLDIMGMFDTDSRAVAVPPPEKNSAIPRKRRLKASDECPDCLDNQCASCDRGP
ncbi:unnamed protein product [Calypogeia fissa]